jgi:low temperature requirement protein LtrA
VVVLGGPFLFIVGTLLFRFVLEHRWARAQIAGIAALIVLAIASPLLDALALSAAAALLLVAVAVGETVGRLRRGRRPGG